MRTHPPASATRPQPPPRRYPQRPPRPLRHIPHLHLALYHPGDRNAHPLLKNFARFARLSRFQRPGLAPPRTPRQRTASFGILPLFQKLGLTPAQTRGRTLQPCTHLLLFLGSLAFVPPSTLNSRLSTFFDGLRPRPRQDF